MGRCVVIQPFDRGQRFDRRYDDVFAPAIRAADLEPYRVDRDAGAVVPIDRIEQELQTATVCLADITLNNPNVWFELGYALASGRPVCLVCCESERDGPFPFDVQHRRVIKYRTDSKSDWTRFGDEVTAALKQLLAQNQQIAAIARLPERSGQEGLTPHEVSALAIAMRNRMSESGGVGTRYLYEEMSRAGFNELGSSLACERLVRSGLLERFEISPDRYDDGPAPGVRPTEAGITWLLQNEKGLVLEEPKRHAREKGDAGFDDIPF